MLKYIKVYNPALIKRSREIREKTFQKSKQRYLIHSATKLRCLVLIMDCTKYHLLRDSFGLYFLQHEFEYTIFDSIAAVHFMMIQFQKSN